MKHYLIYEGSRIGHNCVYFVLGESIRSAIENFLTGYDHGCVGLVIHSDGSITVPDGNKIDTYPNLLSYIESDYKARDNIEWQIYELPDWVWRAREVNVFCGEDTSDVEAHLKTCRPCLHQDYPRSRAHGFIWYLNDGCLTTFYKRHKYGPIEILGRYFEPNSSENVVKWEGTDDELLEKFRGWPKSYPEPLDEN